MVLRKIVGAFLLLGSVGLVCLQAFLRLLF
jgi:TRAP-type C4-dicarboxylate transport system permease small subunit